MGGGGAYREEGGRKDKKDSSSSSRGGEVRDRLAWVEGVDLRKLLIVGM